MIALQRASRCNLLDVLIRHPQPTPAKRTHRALWIAETVTLELQSPPRNAEVPLIWRVNYFQKGGIPSLFHSAIMKCSISIATLFGKIMPIPAFPHRHFLIP